MEIRILKLSVVSSCQHTRYIEVTLENEAGGSSTRVCISPVPEVTGAVERERESSRGLLEEIGFVASVVQ